MWSYLRVSRRSNSDRQARSLLVLAGEREGKNAKQALRRGEYRVEGSVLDELGLGRLPPAAEAGLHFLGLYGTSELVPFPSMTGRRIYVSAKAGTTSAAKAGLF
jgi:hypothetical protein